MIDAVGRPRAGFQPAFCYWLAADFTVAVTAVRDPGQSRLDLHQGGAALLQQRGSLGKLKSDSGALGIMFVINVRVVPGSIRGSDVLPKGRQQQRFPGAL
ncbi:hypothetical protein Arth_2151 [Arthrobacter sp. FB24]|nr:hypothetical protein Arth_2151 [Arthrobacter sp. FB24]